MNSEHETAARDLVAALERGENKTTPVILNDPVIGLRSDIVGFLKERIDLVHEVEELRRVVRTSMMEDVTTLTFEQKERLHSLLGSDARSTAESILNIFKAAPGAPSPLAEIMRERNLSEDEAAKASSKLSSKQLQSVEDFMMVLASAAERFSVPVPGSSPVPTSTPDPWVTEPEEDQP